MKHVFSITFILYGLAALAQTDSIQIKLEQYKKWHDSNLISDEEYLRLKGSVLKLNTSIESSQQITTKVEKKVPIAIDSVQLSRLKLKADSKIFAGSGFLVLGTIMLITNFTIPDRSSSNDKVLAHTILLTIGTVSLAGGAALLPIGIVQLHKYKKKKEDSVMLGIANTGVTLALNF